MNDRTECLGSIRKGNLIWNTWKTFMCKDIFESTTRDFSAHVIENLCHVQKHIIYTYKFPRTYEKLNSLM